MAIFENLINKYKKPHSCDGEDRDDPDSWDDPLIYDQPYYSESVVVEPPTEENK